MIKITVNTNDYITLPSDLSEISLQEFVHYHSVLKHEGVVFEDKKQQLKRDIEEIESDLDEWVGSHRKRRLKELAEKKALLANFSQDLSPLEAEQLAILQLKVVSYFAKQELEIVHSSPLLKQLNSIYERLYFMLEYYNAQMLFQHNSQQVFEFTHQQQVFFIHRTQVHKLSNGNLQEELFSTLNFADYIGLLTINEVAISKALESAVANVRDGKIQDLFWVLPYLARQKNEVLPTDNRPKRKAILKERYEFFQDIPADIAINVSWFFFAFNKLSVKDTK
ncbi:MAG: hypothetical protein ACPG5B_02185 [Chitinophagales bacterium]